MSPRLENVRDHWTRSVAQIALARLSHTLGLAGAFDLCRQSVSSMAEAVRAQEEEEADEGAAWLDAMALADRLAADMDAAAGKEAPARYLVGIRAQMAVEQARLGNTAEAELRLVAAAMGANDETRDEVLNAAAQVVDISGMGKAVELSVRDLPRHLAKRHEDAGDYAAMARIIRACVKPAAALPPAEWQWVGDKLPLLEEKLQGNPALLGSVLSQYAEALGTAAKAAADKDAAPSSSAEELRHAAIDACCKALRQQRQTMGGRDWKNYQKVALKFAQRHGGVAEVKAALDELNLKLKPKRGQVGKTGQASSSS